MPFYMFSSAFFVRDTIHNFSFAQNISSLLTAVFVCVCMFFRLPRVTVCHEYLGSRVFRVPGATAVGHIKELVTEETGLPVSEQRLLQDGRPVGDA